MASLSTVNKFKKELNKYKFPQTSNKFLYHKILKIFALFKKKDKRNHSQLQMYETELPSFKNMITLWELKCLVLNRVADFIRENGCLPKKDELLIDGFWDMHNIWKIEVIYAFVSDKAHYESIKNFMDAIRDNGIKISNKKIVVRALRNYEKRNKLSHNSYRNNVSTKNTHTGSQIRDAIIITDDTEESLTASNQIREVITITDDDTDEPAITANQESNDSSSDSGMSVVSLEEFSDSSSDSNKSNTIINTNKGRKRKRKQDNPCRALPQTSGITESMMNLNYENYDDGEPNKFKKIIKLLNEFNEL